MNNTIKEFLVGLGFQIDEAGLRKFTDSITSASLRTAAFGAAMVAASGLIVKGISSVANEFTELDLLAQKYNSTASEIDDFVDAAEMVGVGGDTAKQALASMNKVVGEASMGIGRGKVVLEKLGIAAKDASGKVRPTVEVMSDLQAKLATMDRGQAMAMMEKLGLDPQMLRMFNGELGDLAMIQSEMSANDKSVGLDFEKAVAESKAFNKAMIGMKTQARLVMHWFETLWQSIAVSLMPMVREGIDKVSDTFTSLRKSLQDNGGRIVAVLTPIIKTILKIASAFISLAGRAIGIVVDVFSRVLGIIGKVNDATDGWAGYILAALAAWKFLNLGFLATPIGMLIGLGVAILALYDDFMTWKEGGESLVDWGSGFGEILMYVTAGVAALGAAFVATKAIMLVYAASMGMVNTAITAFSVISKIGAAGMWLFNAAMSANPIGLIIIAITALIAAGALLIANWSTVKAWFSEFFGWLGAKWQEMVGMASGLVDSLGSLFGGKAVTASATVAHTVNAGRSAAVPTPTTQAAMNSTQSVAQTTNINVSGGSNPQATAQAVASAQGGVNKNMARNVKGAVR